MSALRFDILHRDATTAARVGRVETPHGGFDTPAFMPVGTQGAMKGILPRQVASPPPLGIEAQIILGNTYHLMLRPGSELVAAMGGLHQWMRWDRPILTDSGGFQVFSLGEINTISEEGVSFRSHLDGARIDLTPERSMRVQNELGSDIIMAFDECPPAEDVESGNSDSGSEHRRRVEAATDRTARWLERCVTAHARKGDQALFGIVQGGTWDDLRVRSVEQVTQHDLPGYAIGGVAVGEGSAQIRRVVEATAPRLPADRPRYLMGVGYERDIVAAVRAGVDMFDCVLPTRNGRTANAFTPTGQIRLRNAKFKDDPRPLVEGCDCPACGSGFSRSYLRHLFAADEMLGPILLSLHNLRHFGRLMLDIRHAIQHNAWSALAERYPLGDALEPLPAPT